LVKRAFRPEQIQGDDSGGKDFRAWWLDEAPELPLPDWALAYLRKDEKAYLIREGWPDDYLVVCVLSQDPERDGKNLSVVGP
jgi:hypothetical protein